MKKLIVALAAVAMAVGAQAAAVSWTTAVLYTPTSATDGTFTSTTAKSAGMSVSAVIAFFTNDDNAITTITSGLSSSSITKAGKLTATTVGYDFLVDTTYKYEITYTGTMYDKEFTMTTSGSFTQDKGTGDYSLTVPTAAAWTTAAVPEPTSGLLMLLGMAGLALKRKRA